MTSWQLFRYLNIFKHHKIENHPVYERESGRAIDWTRLTERIARWLSPLIPTVAAAYMLVTWLDSPLQTHLEVALIVGMGAFLLTPSLAPWALALGLLIGPAVAEERQRGTWPILRITPGGIQPILLAKLRAALWPLRHPLHLLRHVWLVMAFPITLGLMHEIVTAAGIIGDDRSLNAQLVCGSGGLVLVAICVLFVASFMIYFADRTHQLILMAMAALAASTTAGTPRLALIGGVIAALLMWIVETAGAAMLVLLLPGNSAPADMNMLVLLLLGPVGGYSIDLPLGPALAATTITFAVREILIQVLWRWSLVAAQR